MAKRFFRVSEVLNACRVNKDFVVFLERKGLIQSQKRGSEKVFPLEQVDRIRVAHLLLGELGVNLEGVEVALHLRAQIIRMRRELDVLSHRLENHSRRS